MSDTTPSPGSQGEQGIEPQTEAQKPQKTSTKSTSRKSAKKSSKKTSSKPKSKKPRKPTKAQREKMRRERMLKAAAQVRTPTGRVLLPKVVGVKLIPTKQGNDINGANIEFQFGTPGPNDEFSPVFFSMGIENSLVQVLDENGQPLLDDEEQAIERSMWGYIPQIPTRFERSRQRVFLSRDEDANIDGPLASIRFGERGKPGCVYAMTQVPVSFDAQRAFLDYTSNYDVDEAFYLDDEPGAEKRFAEAQQQAEQNLAWDREDGVVFKGTVDGESADVLAMDMGLLGLPLYLFCRVGEDGHLLIDPTRDEWSMSEFPARFDVLVGGRSGERSIRGGPGPANARVREIVRQVYESALPMHVDDKGKTLEQAIAEFKGVPWGDRGVGRQGGSQRPRARRVVTDVRRRGRAPRAGRALRSGGPTRGGGFTDANAFE